MGETLKQVKVKSIFNTAVFGYIDPRIEINTEAFAALELQSRLAYFQCRVPRQIAEAIAVKRHLATAIGHICDAMELVGWVEVQIGHQKDHPRRLLASTNSERVNARLRDLFGKDAIISKILAKAENASIDHWRSQIEQPGLGQLVPGAHGGRKRGRNDSSEELFEAHVTKKGRTEGTGTRKELHEELTQRHISKLRNEVCTDTVLNVAEYRERLEVPEGSFELGKEGSHAELRVYAADGREIAGIRRRCASCWYLLNTVDRIDSPPGFHFDSKNATNNLRSDFGNFLQQERTAVTYWKGRYFGSVGTVSDG